MDTETITDTDEQLDDQGKNWKAAREKMDTQAQELASAKRELAFLKAGVDMDSKAGQLLAKAYDGELDAEAIRKEAQELGALSAGAQPEPEVEVNESDRQQTALRQSASNNSVSDEVPVANVYETGQAEFDADLKSGKTNEEALAAFISKVNFYGQSADPRMQQQVDVRPITEQIHREARAKKGWG